MDEKNMSTIYSRMYLKSRFLWQTLIQTIEYSINDAIRIDKKQFILILYLSMYTLLNDFDGHKWFWQKKIPKKSTSV